MPPSSRVSHMPFGAASTAKTPVSPNVSGSLGSSHRRAFPTLLACWELVSKQVTWDVAGSSSEEDTPELNPANHGFYNLQKYRPIRRAPQSPRAG